MSLPYGLRDVKVTLLTDDGTATVGTAVDLPAAQTFTFSETEEYQELRGDDRVITTRGQGPSIEWSLEHGGISLEALVIINGGTLTVTGTTPDEVRRYRKKVTDARPFFKVEGQAISDSGGDFHTLVYRCRANSKIEGEHKDGEFWITKASGVGLGSNETATLEAIYDFVENETVTPIA